MVVVSVSLDRKSNIYLTGETATLEVHVVNDGKTKEILAWGSVQLTCDRTFGRRKAIDGVTSTSISKSASNVFSSLPSVLFCDLELLPRQSKTFSCKVPIPLNGLPPSFKGQNIRYTNRITVGVARIRSTVRLLYVPLRIISSIGIDTKISHPLDPFIAQTSSEPTISELMISAVDGMTAPRKPCVYSLTNERGKISTLTLFKKVFRLGEDIVGHMSFMDSVVRTIQFSSILETVESISEDIEGSIQYEPHISIISRDETECLSLVDTHFRLSIPMNYPPSFNNDQVHFKWRIRFELTITPICDLEENEDDTSLYQAPLTLDIDRLSWSTDIFILPSSPYNITLTDQTIYTSVCATI